jgi:hypothetical protein
MPGIATNKGFLPLHDWPTIQAQYQDWSSNQRGSDLAFLDSLGPKGPSIPAFRAKLAQWRLNPDLAKSLDRSQADQVEDSKLEPGAFNTEGSGQSVATRNMLRRAEKVYRRALLGQKVNPLAFKAAERVMATLGNLNAKAAANQPKGSEFKGFPSEALRELIAELAPNALASRVEPPVIGLTVAQVGEVDPARQAEGVVNIPPVESLEGKS